ncbi:MAG: hypothetical protein EXX96DRAFT_288951 [Benjaminiella poitrasii]|nr:MAG: hypothetical protein EXX96DRAFT_288951 [Benjaminiella poitrasii]
MFEPTIKYRRVNDPLENEKQSRDEIAISNANDTGLTDQVPTPAEPTIVKNDTQEKTKGENDFSYSFEEEEGDSKIEVDPNDKERIIVTLSTGKKYSADRYCPHVGADLSYHGRVSEDDYPPEIGPVLMCSIHYWEFALEKEGKGGGGWATINACSLEKDCAFREEKKKLEW